MSSSFQVTRWTIVSRARGSDAGAQLALSELCEAYYEPVLTFLRREGRDDDAAREVAHSFFAHMLAKGVGQPAEESGRFRSYLLRSLRNFIGKERSAAVRQKRGGAHEHQPFCDEEVSGAEVETRVFDQAWAFHLLQRALDQLELDYAKNERLFLALRPWIDGGAEQRQAEVATELGMNPTAIKVAIHRLRRRFRELIRAEISQTLAAGEDLEEELRYLITAAGQ